MMESPTVIAAALVTVIAALGGAIVTVINALANAQDRRAAVVARSALADTATSTDHKADTIIQKAVEIHALANSQLSTVTAALAVANEKIEGMAKLIAALVTAKTETAAALATTPPRAGRATDAPPAPIPVTVVNTAEDAVPVTRIDDASASGKDGPHGPT